MSNPLVRCEWTPDAPGCTPGPYGGYYDASGKLHCAKANMPKDDKGYCLISYIDEYGGGHLTYEDMQKYKEIERRISAGGTVTGTVNISDIFG